jgi:hypothetical protein
MTTYLEEYVEYIETHRQELTKALNNDINILKLRNQAANAGVEMTPSEVHELIDLLKYSLDFDSEHEK